MSDLKIISYNCKNFNGAFRKQYISKILSKCDFLLLQEHWLYEENFDCFDSIGNVCYHGKSAMNSDILQCGRPYGGVAFVWRNDIAYKVEPIDTVSVRLCCIRLLVGDGCEILIFNVYMPCDDGGNYGNVNEYQDVLSEISVISQNNDASNIIIAGDFNTSFNRNSPQSNELRRFCTNEDLEVCRNLACAKVSYTFECMRSHSRTEIDHCLVSSGLSCYVKDYHVLDDVDNMSDHLPLVTQFDIACEYLETRNPTVKRKPAWYKVDIRHVELYKQWLKNELGSIIIPMHAVRCKDVWCTKHSDDLNKFHDDIVNACIRASKLLPQVGKAVLKGGMNKNPVPGWSEHCAPKKNNAIYWHRKWKECGKPQSGFVFEMRKNSRSEYHRAVKKVQRNCDKLRSEKMIKCILQNDTRNYWKEVRKIRCSSRKIPCTVDNLTCDKEIAGLFADKFKELYNVVGYETSVMNALLDDIDKGVSDYTDQCKVDDVLFTESDVKAAVKKISLGKSDGNIGVYSDHIVHGGQFLQKYLLLLFNSMVIHGCSPDVMNVGTMLPIPKGKRSNISSSENFRGICLQSILCKVLDHMILHKEKESLVTSTLQFGFKPGLSASTATSIVTETIDYFLDNGSSVYALALDASKAFDRVKFTKLFECLIDRGVNPMYNRLLVNMYRQQKVCVNFNSTTSDYFSVSNGVKQGGVLSPTLYSVYVDGLLDLLKNSGMGCRIGNVYTGSISYADDLMLLSPSVQGLDRMIALCENYAKKFSIIFNGKKSKVMLFSKKSCKSLPDVIVSGERVEYVTSMNYLGHQLAVDRTDSLLNSVQADFNQKVNSFIGEFKHLSCVIKNDLFSKFCTSLYGANLCALYDENSMAKMCIQYRKALRKIWCLPYRTHCELIPFISDQLPVDVLMYRRFMRFFHSSLNSKNMVVSLVFRQAMRSQSRMGRNLRYIVSKFNLPLGSVSEKCINKICCDIRSKWLFGCKEKSVIRGCQIRELAMCRDSIDKWLLNSYQCKEIVDKLCVE